MLLSSTPTGLQNEINVVLKQYRDRTSKFTQIPWIYINNQTIFSCTCKEYSNKAKVKILDIMKTMWSLGSFGASPLFVFFLLLFVCFCFFLFFFFVFVFFLVLFCFVFVFF